MEAYDRRMAALRQGEYLPPTTDSYDFNADMKALSGAHKKKSADHDTYMSKEQLMELRKVQQERIEVISVFVFRCCIFLAHLVSLGWQNETVGYGCEAELWSSNGRHTV